MWATSTRHYLAGLFDVWYTKRHANIYAVYEDTVYGSSQVVEADLTAVAHLVSTASGCIALQPGPPAQPALPAAELPVHQPKQLLSLPQPHQLPCHLPCHLAPHLPEQLPQMPPAVTSAPLRSQPQSGFLQKQLHLQTVYRPQSTAVEAMARNTTVHTAMIEQAGSPTNVQG